MTELYPKVNKVVINIERLIILFLIPVFVLNYLGYQKLIGQLSLVFLLIIYVCTLWLIHFFYQKRDKLIRFILLGSAFAATGHLFAMTSTILMSMNWWLSFPPLYFTMIGILFEIFYFNTGLGYKSKAEQEAKLRMQDELILQLEEKRKSQEQFLNIRNRLAADLHDEVGSTLSSIIIYSEVADNYVDTEPEKTHSILMRIRNSSKRVIDAMRDIVWATHTSDNNQLNWSLKLRETAHSLLQESSIEFYFEEEVTHELLEFLPEVKRNLLLVFREAISNAMKHSKCTRIDCRMSIEKNRFQLSISDNGMGFDNSKISAGIGLKNMRNRMYAIGGTLDISGSHSGGVSIQLNWEDQILGPIAR
jgi:signal transduction histidine kinase